MACHILLSSMESMAALVTRWMNYILCIEALEIFTMFSAQNVPPLNISEDFALASDRWTKHKLPAQIISDKDGSMD